MKKLSARTLKIVEALEELFNEEHGGCDQRTCDMSTCAAHGYMLWAIYLFDSCGAASEEFTELYAKLPKSFYKHARAEADEFCETVPHDQCPHCNAVVWDLEDDEHEVHCDSCARTFERSTPVVFRKFRKGGDVIALFPKNVNYPDGCIESYQHIGQHGAADFKHCLRITYKATPEEYAPLKKELEGVGYRLDVQGE